MCTIPDKGEGDNDLQSILFQEYLEVLVAGIDGMNCVLSGLVVTGGADMTPAVAKGSGPSKGGVFAVAAAGVTIGTADATNPRLDLIVVTSAGALAVRAGTAAASPKPPARTANDARDGPPHGRGPRPAAMHRDARNPPPTPTRRSRRCRTRSRP